MTASLYIGTASLSLAAALTECDGLLAAGESAIALLSSPNRCKFARLAKGASLAFAGEPIGVDEIYEARVFTPTWEMRWLKDALGGANHRAAVLSSGDVKLWNAAAQAGIVGTIDDGQYLLWGDQHSELPNGWTRLTTSRIGHLDVPFAASGRIVLKTVEYLREYDHGNIAVAEERLVKLAPL